MTNGYMMFYNCTALTSFSSDLSSLTSGSEMFSNCHGLTSFTSDLPSLTDGNRMFHLCSLDAPSVKNIALTINKNTSNARFDIGVANNIANDEQVKKDLGLIKHKGWKLWINGGNLPMDYTLPKYAGCTDKNSIAQKNSNYLTTDIVNGAWGEHLPDLETCFGIEGEGVFMNCYTLTTFNADLSSLTNGARMFNQCSNLTSFNSNLSSLTNGSSMFNGCENLTSFNVDLPSLTNGVGMFSSCSNLSEFNGDLSALTLGAYMFENCTRLFTFSSNLSSLQDGTNMFSNCQLSLTSV